jgi:ribosomal protein L3 glutamine methyltransferase
MRCWSNCSTTITDPALKLTAELTTVADFLRWMTTRLSRADVYFGHGTDNAWDEAAALLCGRLGVAAEKLEYVLAARLTESERNELVRLLERRIVHRVPVPYLVGEAWFAGRRYLIEPDVLIPRSPIAELINAQFAPWLARLPDRILDLGAGSGCIGIACAHAFPNAEVVLSDIDEAALALARRNVAGHRLGDRVRVVRADVFDGMPDGRFDLIVTNPPYVSSSDLAEMPREYQHEPLRALAAGVDGLDIVRRILAQARVWLTPDGLLVGEVGASASNLVAAFPELPFFWPELEQGGHGVFVIEAGGLS